MADVARWCTEDDPCPDCAAGRDVDGCWRAGYRVDHPYDRPGPPFRFAPLRGDCAQSLDQLDELDQLGWRQSMSTPRRQRVDGDPALIAVDPTTGRCTRSNTGSATRGLVGRRGFGGSGSDGS
jgi:hypothetical protein